MITPCTSNNSHTRISSTRVNLLLLLLLAELWA
jgi:hypothetical protein